MSQRRGHISSIDSQLDQDVVVDAWETGPATTRGLPFEKAATSSSPTFDMTQINMVETGVRKNDSRKHRESRKLLYQVLVQLSNRTKAPSVTETITRQTHEASERGLVAFADTLRDAVKRNQRQYGSKLDHRFMDEEDSDNENNNTFTTDETIDLMVQLKDVLTMAATEGWNIFDESPSAQDDIGDESSKLYSTFRKSRNSFRAVGKRSRSMSPSKGSVQISELLSLFVSVISSVVADDCRYKVASPRPSRPQNTLQVLTLNVAQFILHNHRHNSSIVSQIAFAMIPAFHTFAPQMLSRLLSFFEASVLRISLQALDAARPPHSEVKSSSLNSGHTVVSTFEQQPIVSIQIEEVPEEMPRFAINANSSHYKVQSTNNPGLSPNVYHLAALIPPVINAILETCNVSDAAGSELLPSQAFRLIQLLAGSKLDAYNDLLEVVAYGGTKSRRQAIASLAMIWPKSVGHTTVSNPLNLADNDLQLQSSLHDIEEDTHQFMPWFFEAGPLSTPLHNHCRSCESPIHGFCLLCICCMTAVHFDCYDYPLGNYDVQYSMGNDPGMQRVAMCRISTIKGNGPVEPPGVNSGNHSFKATNWFTLCLCMGCHRPLWGSIGQGVKCEHCPLSLHAECVPLIDPSKACPLHVITSDDMTVDWSTLQLSCMEHYPVLQQSTQQISLCTYEEISVYHNVLRAQLQIYDNGVAFGSIVIHRERDHPQEDDTGKQQSRKFLLHDVFNQCEKILSSHKLSYSSGTQEFMQDTTFLTNTSHLVMYDWSYLEHLTATVKSSLKESITSSATTSDFLSVQQPLTSYSTEDSLHTYESLSLRAVELVLRRDFGMVSDSARKLMLDHLHHMSCFDRVDGTLLPFRKSELGTDILCVFPLPLGLDLSVNVETLVSSIEASLGDLDISANEFGFLLATKRFWPNRLVSEYALKRLSGKILSWMLDEDDNLALILREFVAKQRRIPGVRSNRNPQLWPSSQNQRPNVNNLTSNGGDFVVARRHLIAKYALPWLLDLHDLDSALYTDIIFGACLSTAVDKEGHTSVSESPLVANRCDAVLRYMMKLLNYGVLFDVHDAVFLRWTDFVLKLNVAEQALPSLHRFLSRENDSVYPGSARSTDVNNTFDVQQASFVDPLHLLLSAATQCEAALSRTLSFFSVMIKSGVEIPITVFQKLFSTITESHSSFDTANSFIKLVSHSLWLRTSKRQEYQNLISSMHVHFLARIARSLSSGEDSIMAFSFIRWSFGACLRIYGCERSSILAAGIIDVDNLEQLPSRRKVGTRESGVDDPIYLDPGYLSALQTYLQCNVDDVSCLVAKFLNMFLTESPFLEAFETDNFILRNGRLVSSCAWAIYDIQRDDIAIVRTNLMLRSLLVDTEPFQDIMRLHMDPNTTLVQQRLSGVNRLFRMISDVTSPAFDVEGRQWRSSVIDIFQRFFSALWVDPCEEIRTAAKVASAALLTAHLDVISQCWSEALTRAPIDERIGLVSFLIQLRPHFPKWKVLSWESIVDTLSEYDYSHGTDSLDRNEHNTTLGTDPDMVQLKVSTMLLCLQMLEDGIEIDSFSLMKIKVQFVTIVGFSQVTVTRSLGPHSFNLRFSDSPEISESAYPCIEELVHLIDAPHHTKVTRSALGISDHREGELVDVCIGWPFLDTVLCMIATIHSLTPLPVVTLKSLLETLYIAIHKCDFEGDCLRHLQPQLQKAVLRSVGLLAENISFELRQLALSIAQASIKKWHTFMGATISTMIELVATYISSQTSNNQDTLVAQGKLLIGNALQNFCNNGLLINLFRRSLKTEFFAVLNLIFNAQGSPFAVTLSEGLLRDTLLRASDCDMKSFPTVLHNIMRFIEIVYSQGYTPDLMIFTGQQLIFFARRMSDGSADGMDPTPLLQISTVLVKHNKKSYRELMPYVETVLRICLNRLRVDEEPLMNLIEATVSTRSKYRDPGPGLVDVATVLCDVLLDGFRLKTKMLPVTIKSVIECLISVDKNNAPIASASHLPIFYNMVDDAHNFLQNNAWNEENIDWDFQAATAAARLLLRATNRDPASFQRFTEPSFDKGPKFYLTLRSWNIIVLVTLQEMQADWTAMVYSQFSSFSTAYSTVLRGYVSSGISSAATATYDLNQAHIALRLWLMLASSMTGLIQSNELVINAVWNELWPPYESFLTVLEGEAQVGLYPALMSLASTSVADTFLYLRSLKTSLALDTSAHIAIIGKMASLSQGDATLSKIARAMKAMTESPPEVPGVIFLDQIAKELVATEKIRLIEMNGSLRYAGDRFRKDGRMGTS